VAKRRSSIVILDLQILQMGGHAQVVERRVKSEGRNLQASTLRRVTDECEDLMSSGHYPLADCELSHVQIDFGGWFHGGESRQPANKRVEPATDNGRSSKRKRG